MKVARNDPRVVRAYKLTVGAAAVVFLSYGASSTFAKASVWPPTIGALGFLLMALIHAYQARLRRQPWNAINVPIGLFAGFSTATCSCGDADPPRWLLAFGIVLLTACVTIGLPYAIVIVVQEQDERERKIVTSAMSIAFLVTVLVVAAFALVEQYTDFTAPSASWILLPAAASWFGSYYVLKERM